MEEEEIRMYEFNGQKMLRDMGVEEGGRVVVEDFTQDLMLVITVWNRFTILAINVINFINLKWIFLD